MTEDDPMAELFAAMAAEYSARVDEQVLVLEIEEWMEGTT